MGATLGRLFVSDYNIDKKQMISHYCSIDYAVSRAMNQANKIFPLNTVCETLGWQTSDRIIRIANIPMVLPMPEAYACYDDTVKVDTTGLNVMPLMIHLGGTSQGWGTDKAKETDIMVNPGFFLVSKEGDEPVKYHVRDFAIYLGLKGFCNYGETVDAQIAATANMTEEELARYYESLDKNTSQDVNTK